MSQILLIDGGKPLRGAFRLSPSVRIAQYLIASSILSEGNIELTNIPKSKLINDLLNLIEFLGGKYQLSLDGKLVLNTDDLTTLVVPHNMISQPVVAWILFISMVSKYGKAAISTQLLTNNEGENLEELLTPFVDTGLKLRYEEGYLIGELPPKLNQEIVYRLENASPIVRLLGIVLSVLALNVRTVIKSNIIDPDTRVLIDFMNKMQAKVNINTDGMIQVEGVDVLAATEYLVPNDNDQAPFVSTLAALTGGDVKIYGIERDVVVSFLSKLQQAGVNYNVNKDIVQVWRDKKSQLNPFNIKTSFSSSYDKQWLPYTMVLMSQASGISEIEGITRPNGLSYLNIVRDLGIETQNTNQVQNDENNQIQEFTLQVFGPVKLKNGIFNVHDHLSGLLTLAASLITPGKSEINSFEFVTERYPDLVQKLIGLGAKLKFK